MQTRRGPIVLVTTSVVTVAVLYLVLVRTRWGQEVDDLAFEGRRAVSAGATRNLDRMLRTVTEQSLFLLGGAIVLAALAQRRLRLAIVVGCCMSGAVLTTEVLKLHLLERPSFSGVAGSANNSFPSGHATIGMVLALGIVMVAPSALRRVAAVAGSVLAAVFGTAVMASGWHRPSDVVGAYAVALAWFAAGHLVLQWFDEHHPHPRGAATPSDRRPSGRLLVVAAAAIAAFLLLALWVALDAEGLRTVPYAGRYVVASVVVGAVGVGVVLGFALLTGERARQRRDALAAEVGAG